MASDLLEFDTLKKGDVIQAEHIAELYNMDRLDRKYPLCVMGLMSEIERRLSGRGYPVTTRSEKGSIRILSDEEALRVNDSRFRKKVEGVLRDHGRMTQIDVSNLDDDDKKLFDRKIEIQGKIIQGMLRSHDDMRLDTHERITPGLPRPRSEQPESGPIQDDEPEPTE